MSNIKINHKPNHKRWKIYSADGNGTSVNDLTEAEAKNCLCDAMDVIQALTKAQETANTRVNKILEKHGYMGNYGW